MSVEDINNEEFNENGGRVKIPINDKRRFNEAGEKLRDDEDVEPVAPRSPLESDLEAKLKAETERREAAEAKLVGVQAKFEEAKRDLERETSEMRTRMQKTLEDRARQA